MRDDRPAGPGGVDAVTDGRHVPADPVARHMGRPLTERLAGPAGADHRVDEQHVRRRHGDDCLPWRGDGLRNLG